MRRSPAAVAGLSLLAVAATILAQPPEEEPVILGKPAGWSIEPAGESGVQAPPPAATAPSALADRLGRAADHLAGGGTEGMLGPYRLSTDVADERLLGFFDKVAGAVPEAYAERYGLAPAAPAAGRIVLFARQEDYRAFEAEGGELAGMDYSGHAGGGVAALFVGDRDREEVALTLVHEITHLLNQGLGGPPLPPWLDEGMAGDLALARLRRDGSLDTDLIQRLALQRSALGRWRIDGPLALVAALPVELEAGRLPPLGRLAELDRDGFLAAGDRRLVYAESILALRYLEAPDGADLAAPLRAYLAAVHGAPAAHGEPVAPSLAAALGTSWESLEAGFRRWLVQLGHRLGLTR